MYLPLRLALELAADDGSRHRAVAFQSTTRSPVHAIDRPGIRSGGGSTSRAVSVHRRGLEPAGVRHVYNCGWPEP